MDMITHLLTILLTVAFAVTLLALFAKSLYVLRRRRRTYAGSNDLTATTLGDCPYQSPSKELLYFFCWKSHVTSTRIEPDTAITTIAAPTTASLPSAAAAAPFPERHVVRVYDNDNDNDDQDDDDNQVMTKYWSLYGHSRFLFTIKEEAEKEGERATCSNSDAGASTRDRVVVVLDDVEPRLEAVAVATTPFSTPSDSPPYYTPSPSPPGEDHQFPSFRVDHNAVIVCRDETMTQRNVLGMR